MTEELLNRRIEWAETSLNWFYHYKSEWGIKYWTEVVSKLQSMKPITYH